MKYFVCFLILLLDKTRGHIQGRFGLQEVFKWKQMTYDFNGHLLTLYLKYQPWTDPALAPGGVTSTWCSEVLDKIYESSSDSELQTQKQNNVADAEKFFLQYNNVPIGMEVFGNRVFVTVPRRRHGIPSTLNYVKISSGTSPALNPYPDTKSRNKFVSVYRPRVDVCGRLWMVDTGHLEVPGERKQIQPPAIVVYDLNTDEEIVRYELKSTDLVNERSSAGLTSITVDVHKKSCDDAYAYINDLATEGMIVFSLKIMDSWRINHRSFVHDENAMNFTAAGYVINWKDGLFSITLTDPDTKGKRKAFYHPLVSTQEFAIDTEFLKNNNFPERNTYFGERGNNTQSGSHDYHAPSRIIFYANVAQDAILCWNIDTEMTPENVAIVAQDHKKLAYISDLKIVGDEVYVLVNQIPKFIYSRFDINEYNFFIHRYRVFDLILGTVCDIAAP